MIRNMLCRVIEGYDFNHALSVLVPVLGGAAFNTAIGIGRQTKIAAFRNRVSRDLFGTALQDAFEKTE